MFDTLTHAAHFVASLLTLYGLTDGYRLEIKLNVSSEILNKTIVVQ